MELIARIGACEVLAGNAPDLALPEPDRPRRAAVVSQPGRPAEVAQAISHNLGATHQATVIEIPDGEAAKSIASLTELYRARAAAELGRDDSVVAVGGGAALDVIGFAAATWRRGVEVTYVPTTLLAAVDASIGGKTAIDVVAKNDVGVTRLPAQVVLDLGLLADLPEPLIAEGLVEVLKVGLVADPELFAVVAAAGGGARLHEVVPRAVRAKVEIVADDLEETGRREILNFGHTIGHAVEHAAGITHGMAVGLGLIAESRASGAVGFDGADRVASAVAGLGLPERLAFDRDEAKRLVIHDKKRRGGELRMVLIPAVGEARTTVVDDATVVDALDTIWEP